MSPEGLIAHVDEAIARSLRSQAWIDVEILSIAGFSTGTIRRLISNLVHLPKEEATYCELGLWKGAGVCSAMSNSPHLHVYGVENGSQPFHQSNVLEELARNVAAHRHGAKSVTIIDADCLTVDLSLIKHPIDILFVDPAHDLETQRDALLHFAPCLADVAVVMIDDFAWPGPRLGTKQALERLAGEFKVEKSWELGDGTPDQPTWHNNVALYVVSRLK